MTDHDASFANDILATIGLPVLALDADLRVEVANEAFLRAFQVSRDETIGHLIYDLGNRQWDIPDLRRLLEEVLEQENWVTDYRVEHVFEHIGRRVMLLNARRIQRADATESILLAITDDTEREQLRHELEGRIEFADKLIDSVREALLILHWDLRVHSANRPFYDLFGVDRAETEGRLIYELGNRQWDIPELRCLLEDILPREQSFDDYEIEHEFQRIGRRVMLLNGRRLNHLNLIVLAIRDITGLRELEQTRREHEQRQHLLVELNDTLLALSDPSEVQREACRVLAENLDADGVSYAEFDRPGYVTIQEDHVRGNAAHIAGSYAVSDFPSVIEVMKSGKPFVCGDVARSAAITPEERARYAALSIGSVVKSTMRRNGVPVAAIGVSMIEPREWSAHEVSLIEETARRTWDAVLRARSDAARRESEMRLARELEDARLLQDLSTQLISEQPPQALYAHVVEAARALMRSDAASLQAYIDDNAKLELVAHVGFHPDSAAFWQWIDAEESTVCGRALAAGQRVVVRDIGALDTAPQDLAAFRQSGIIAVQSTPLVSSNQRIMGTIQTHWCRRFEPPERDFRHFDVLARLAADLIERVRSAAALRESEERYRRLFESIDESFAIVEPVYDQHGKAVDYRYTQINPAFETITGQKDVVGKTALEVDPGLDRDWIRTIGRIAKTGKSERATQDRKELGKVVEVLAYRVDEPNGQVAVLSRDVTEHRRAEIMQEVSHRAKNVLGVVQAIARATLGDDEREVARKFEQRIQALAANYSLLVRHQWQGVDLDELVRSQLAHFGDLLDNRITLKGPPVAITAAASQTLAMALHELATNAAKYGALSTPDGRVEIAWCVQRDGAGQSRFSMSWRETGGPEVTPPLQTGFGSTVINDMVRMNLGAEVQSDFAPTGLAWEINTSGDRCIEALDGRAASLRQPSGRPDGKPQHSGVQGRVLVVEDEAMMALELKKALVGAGYEVVGLAGSVSQALAQLEQTDCDAVILDVNLGGETAEPIARQLASQGTPFFVMSGYEHDQLPNVFRAARLFQKPVELEALIAELGACLEYGEVKER